MPVIQVKSHAKHLIETKIQFPVSTRNLFIAHSSPFAKWFAARLTNAISSRDLPASCHRQCVRNRFNFPSLPLLFGCSSRAQPPQHEQSVRQQQRQSELSAATQQLCPERQRSLLPGVRECLPFRSAFERQSAASESEPRFRQRQGSLLATAGQKVEQARSQGPEVRPVQPQPARHQRRVAAVEVRIPH